MLRDLGLRNVQGPKAWPRNPSNLKHVLGAGACNSGGDSAYWFKAANEGI